MTGKDANERLNSLQCLLLTDNFKKLLNQVRSEHPEKCAPDDERLNDYLREIASFPNKTIEATQVYFSSFAPHILSQIFDRFTLANRFYKNNYNKLIAVKEQDLDFLIQSLVDIACIEAASSKEKE